MADFLIDLNSFSEGLQVLGESVDAPVGSARVADNIMVTDRGGISPRPGTLQVGTHDPGTTGSDGFHNFLKAFGQADQEIPVKASNGILKYYHPTLLDWYQLMGGYTPGSEFDFAESYGAETDFNDYLYFCNRTELYSRWSGATAVTTAQVNPGDTTVTVGSTLTLPVYATGKITSNALSGVVSAYGLDSHSNPILTAQSSLGASKQWVNFLLTMTSGTCSGLTSLVTTGPADSATVLSLVTQITSGSNHPANGDTFTLSGNLHGYFVDTNNAFAPTNGYATLYVHFTSGVNKGLLAEVLSNDAGYLALPASGLEVGGYGSSFTYNQLTNLPAAGDTYELRALAFPTAGTLTVDTGSAAVSVAYSALLSDTQFSISAWGGSAIPVGAAVAIQPTTYPGNPQGNRLQQYMSRMFVGNVLNANVTTGSSTVTAVPESSTVYYSKAGNAADFTYSATSPASTDGGYIKVPFGGGSVADVASYEGSLAIFKRYYVELDTMGTTSNIVTQVPLKQDFGSVNRAVKGIDDLYFVTADKQITSVSRVALKDTVPQTVNIGLIIKRLIAAFDFSEVVGVEYEQRILFACKRDASSTGNDQVLVYNKENKAFDGIWYVGASHFDIVDGMLCAASPLTPNVVQMFTGDHNDTRTPAARWGIDCSWRSNWIHIVPRRSRFRVKPSQFAIQGINTIGFQGYITDGSVITFSMFSDFSDIPVLQFDFGILPTDDKFMHGADLSAFLGANPLGLAPLGTISDPNPDGERQFRFILYFPDVYCNYLSMGVDSHGLDTSWEVTRFGLGTEEDAAQSDENIKSI
jgi:hypothetical protein